MLLVVAVVAFPTAASSAESAAPRPDMRIAIIGAGPSGLTAAHTLRARGYNNVVVFERESDVGGKVKTHFYKDRPYELGAIIANHDYKVVNSLSKEYGLKVTPIENSYLVNKKGDRWDYVPYIMKTWGILPFTASALNFQAAMTVHPRVQSPGFDGINPELYESMTVFANRHHFEPTAEIVRSFMTGCGYGYYEEVPAMYLLKLIPWLVTTPLHQTVSGGMLFGWSTYDQGWQQLWREVGKDFDVRLNSEVTEVVRYTQGTEEKVKIRAAGRTEIFDRVIVSASLDTAHKFMDLSTEEKDLFPRIHTYRYLVTLVEAENLSMASYVDNVSSDTIGHINFIVQPHPDTNVFAIYQLLDKNMTPVQAIDIAKADIAPFGGKFTNVILQKEWSYFPRVSKNDLLDNFYGRLEGLQGTRATYYTGAIMNFETVENAAEYSKALVEKSFPKAEGRTILNWIRDLLP